MTLRGEAPPPTAQRGRHPVIRSSAPRRPLRFALALQGAPNAAATAQAAHSGDKCPTRRSHSTNASVDDVVFCPQRRRRRRVNQTHLPCTFPPLFSLLFLFFCSSSVSYPAEFYLLFGWVPFFFFGFDFGLIPFHNSVWFFFGLESFILWPRRRLKSFK